MIYTTGTVSTVSGSAIVKGTDTKFKNNNPAINIGMTILIKSGNTNIPYMIKSVNSDTELVLAQPALATATNTTFSIHITEPDNNSDAARAMVAINSYVEYFLDAMNTWMTQTGQTKIEMPNGEVVTLDSIKKMQGDIANKLDIKTGGNVTARVSANPISVTRDGNDYLNIYPPKVGDGKDLGFFQYNLDKAWNGVLKIPRAPSGGTETILTDGINYGTGRVLSFKADYKDKASYIESIWVDNSFRWRIGSMDATSDFQINTGGGARFHLTKDSLTVNGKKVLDNVTPNTVKKQSINRNGFYQCQDIEPYDVMFMGIACTHVSNEQYVFSLWGRGNRFLFSTKDAGKWFGTWEVWTTANARADTNGFIKKASPIIDINPDGTFTTNDESEGATVTRVAQGEYLIEGVLGFNSDAGWGGVDGGIEIPLDVNKQPLIWVNSKVNKDGSILVKTYHRTHPNAPEFARNDIDGFNDGNPIDIPDGRFISVRVQMPEQSIYNVRMREMEEAQKAEEERRQKEEEMKAQFGLGENDALL
ncbi:hypothetical protein [Proteus terrae]|uniref:phage tail fiber protein n=1 Tax=Proteus terrae TaxID=1574161 RepID=UPI002012DB9A|nr:hypothetical protein [Proteus terrae]